MAVERFWTVVRFPNGSWSYGGSPHSPDYEHCEVWRIAAADAKTAVKRAQAMRSRQRRTAGVAVGEAPSLPVTNLKPQYPAWMHEFTDPHTGQRAREPRLHRPADYELQPGDTVRPLDYADGVAVGRGPSCEWREEDPDVMPGTYASACGEMWSFIDGGVNENNVRFCQGCGKPVRVAQGTFNDQPGEQE